MRGSRRHPALLKRRQLQFPTTDLIQNIFQ
jgi:hypothetical protein